MILPTDKYSWKAAWSEFTDPINLVLIIFNVLVFILVLIFWFWFIGTQQLFGVIDSKLKGVSNIINENENIETAVDLFIAETLSNKEEIDNTKNEILERNAHNVTKFHEYLLPLIIVLSLGLIASLGFAVKRKSVFTRVHAWILLFIILAFLTEVFFYLIVVDNFHYVANSTIVVYLLGLHDPEWI